MACAEYGSLQWKVTDMNEVKRVAGDLIEKLDREAMLAWNPRLVRIRPNAAKIAARLHHLLALS